MHISIMPQEAIEYLLCAKGKLIVDATAGKGGHSNLILEKGCRLIAIDCDEEAIIEAQQNLKEFKTATFVNDNFANIKKILKSLGVVKADGILADLGVSTHQLETEGRGFGFEGPLDMRMDKKQPMTAKEVINKWPEEKISKTLFDYGERKFARSIARAITQNRKHKEVSTGEELLEIIKSTMPPKYRFSREHHWATPTFRALRMVVNNDLENLQQFIIDAADCLSQNGRLVIISFHTLEDRIVKHLFKDLAKKGLIKIITKRPLVASEEEIKDNPKALRAKMRVAEKI